GAPARGDYCIRLRLVALRLGDACEPVLLLCRADTAGARAPGRHRRSLSLGAPPGVCRRDPRRRRERDGPLLMACNGDRRPRSAAPDMANNYRGSHLARRIARLPRICPTGALAVASRRLVNA